MFGGGYVEIGWDYYVMCVFVIWCFCDGDVNGFGMFGNVG